MGNYFVGIDTGTQGVRIGVTDEKGNFVTVHEKKWGTDYPMPGWAEQNPTVWWESIEETFGLCCEDLSEDQKMSLVACSVCATSSTTFPIDMRGNPMTKAMMWMDIRSRDIAEEINSSGHERLKQCGGEVSPEWLVPKVLWVK